MQAPRPTAGRARVIPKRRTSSCSPSPQALNSSRPSAANEQPRGAGPSDASSRASASSNASQSPAGTPYEGASTDAATLREDAEKAASPLLSLSRAGTGDALGGGSAKTREAQAGAEALACAADAESHDEGGRPTGPRGPTQEPARAQTQTAPPPSFCERLTSKLKGRAEAVLAAAHAEWKELETAFEARTKARGVEARDALKASETALKRLQATLEDRLERQIRWREKQRQRVRAYQERLRENAQSAAVAEADAAERGAAEAAGDSSAGEKQKEKSRAQTLAPPPDGEQPSRAIKSPHSADAVSVAAGGGGATPPGGPVAPSAKGGGRLTVATGGRRRGAEEDQKRPVAPCKSEKPTSTEEQETRLADSSCAELFFLDEDEKGPGGGLYAEQDPLDCKNGGERENGVNPHQHAAKEGDAEGGTEAATTHEEGQKKREEAWTEDVLEENMKHAQELIHGMRVTITQLAAHMDAIEFERKSAAAGRMQELSRELQSITFHSRGEIERIIEDWCKQENLKLLHTHRAQASIIQRLVTTVDAWTAQHAAVYEKCRVELKIHNHDWAIRLAARTLRREADFASPPEKEQLETQMREREKALSLKRHEVVQEALDCLPACVTPEKVRRWLARLERIREEGRTWLSNLAGDFTDLKDIQRRRCEALIRQCAKRVELYDARVLWGACETASEVATELLEPLQQKHLQELLADLHAKAAQIEERQRGEHAAALRVLNFLEALARFLAAFRASHHTLNGAQRRVAAEAAKDFADATRRQEAVLLALRDEMKEAPTLSALDTLKKKAESELRCLEDLVRARVKALGARCQDFLPQTQERKQRETSKFLHVWALVPLSATQQKAFAALAEAREHLHQKSLSPADSSQLSSPRGGETAGASAAAGPAPSGAGAPGGCETSRATAAKGGEGDDKLLHASRTSLEQERVAACAAADSDARRRGRAAAPSTRSPPSKPDAEAGRTVSTAARAAEKKAEGPVRRNHKAAHAASCASHKKAPGGASRDGSATGAASRGTSGGGAKGEADEGRKRGEKKGTATAGEEEEVDLDKHTYWTDPGGQVYRQLMSFEALLGNLSLDSGVSMPARTSTLESHASAADLPGETKPLSAACASPPASPPPPSASPAAPPRSGCPPGAREPQPSGRHSAEEESKTLFPPREGLSLKEEEGRESREDVGFADVSLRESWKEGLARLRDASFAFVVRTLEELETAATELGEATYSAALLEMKRTLAEFDSTSATVASFAFAYKQRQQQLASHASRLERFLRNFAQTVASQQALLSQAEDELEAQMQELVEAQRDIQQLRLEDLHSSLRAAASAATLSPPSPSAAACFLSAPSALPPQPPGSVAASAESAGGAAPSRRRGASPGKSAATRRKSVKAYSEGDAKGAPEESPLFGGEDDSGGGARASDEPLGTPEELRDGRLGGCLMQQLKRRRKHCVQEQDQMKKNAEKKIQFIEQQLVAGLQKAQAKVQAFFSAPLASIPEREMREAALKRDQWLQEIEKRREDWEARVTSWRERLETTATEGHRQVEAHFASLEDRTARLYGLGHLHGAPKRAAVAALQRLQQHYEAAAQRCFHCFALSTKVAGTLRRRARLGLGDSAAGSLDAADRGRGRFKQFRRPSAVILDFFEEAPSASAWPPPPSPLSFSPRERQAASGTGGAAAEEAGTRGARSLPPWRSLRPQTGDDAEKEWRDALRSGRSIAAPPMAASVGGCSELHTATGGDWTLRRSSSLPSSARCEAPFAGLEAQAQLPALSFLSMDAPPTHERRALSFASHVQAALSERSLQRRAASPAALSPKPVLRAGGGAETQDAPSPAAGSGAAARSAAVFRVNAAHEIRSGYALAAAALLALCQRLQCLGPSQGSRVKDGAEQVLLGLPLLQDYRPSAGAEETGGGAKEGASEKRGARENATRVHSGDAKRRAAGLPPGLTSGGGLPRGPHDASAVADAQREGLTEQESREAVEDAARTTMLQWLLGPVTSLPPSYAAAVEDIEKEFRAKAAATAAAYSPGSRSPDGKKSGGSNGAPAADEEGPVYVELFAKYLRRKAEANRQKLVSTIRCVCRHVRNDLFPVAVCGIFLDLAQMVQGQLEELQGYLGNGRPLDERLNPVDAGLIKQLKSQWETNRRALDAHLKCTEVNDSLRKLCLAEEKRSSQMLSLLLKLCSGAAGMLNASSAFITNGCIGHFEFLVAVLDRLPQPADFMPIDGYFLAAKFQRLPPSGYDKRLVSRNTFAYTCGRPQTLAFWVPKPTAITCGHAYPAGSGRLLRNRPTSGVAYAGRQPYV
ncbi:hypothetical protein BESB_032650 [Besnoitia besnoiti]|uniref:DUF4455 domain-containing protein n=1 Tax=Besnoitia besnoiti TaxID=94643 RepID=A0A2A9LX52_BESBE|nr:uncharacterized protein BESB_032650 [Besnoitia besnoiti]PFH31068.1 hypothetical protein BESB_032650 [Besnoitia besnoiti]